MKSIIMSLLVVLLVSTLAPNASAGTYGFAQFEGQAERGLFVPTLDLLVGGSVFETSLGTIGVEGFGLITDGWGEAYGGPTWTPILELTIGMFVGMETGTETLPRFAGSLLVNVDVFSFSGFVEINQNGLGGLWYKLVSTGQATSWLKLGLEWRRFAGFGLHVTVSVPKTLLEFWVSWTPLEPEKLDGNLVNIDRFLFGGKIGF